MNSQEPTYRYNAQLAGQIEEKWQQTWEAKGVFHAPNPKGEIAGELQGNKYFVLDMFPFPSGKGLHVGHPLGYIATDVVARFRRMCGDNVLYAMGFDAFGLPAEQYALQTGQHPSVTTQVNIDNMKRQLARIGLSHDSRRSLATSDVDFYHWTQWIFLQIFNSWYDPKAPGRQAGVTGRARPISELISEFASGERKIPAEFGATWDDLTKAQKQQIIDSYRLAYIDYAPVNWCPGLGTVLSNEEVTNEGRSERGNFPVFTSKMRQWKMRITAYADRLATDLDYVDWPEKVKSMQRHWIGRSTGAYVDFQVDGYDQPLRVFTTRPDTLFGATFMVVAPEHPLLQTNLVPTNWPEDTRATWIQTAQGESPRAALDNYCAAAAKQSESERGAEERVKTGVFSGIWATNPVNGTRIPIFAADYVLWGYGTGAIMAVPAHDERDHAFAKKYDIDIKQTIAEPGTAHDVTESAWTGDGLVVNSENTQVSLNGLDKEAAKARMIEYLVANDLGEGAVTYRLRDWLFSRQRYWGEPFPVVYDEAGQVYALPESMLPIELPPLEDFSPRTFDPEDSESEPEPPLGRVKDWLEVELDLGDGKRKYWRDANTMPNWAGSCWYQLRYLDPTNQQAFCDPENEEYWVGARPQNGNECGGADLYVGGVEHAVLHLLYSRFWHKILFDLGYVSSFEPFHKLFNQGYIQAWAYTDARGQYVPAEEVEEVPANDGSGEVTYQWQGQVVNREYGKMGKSLKNIVTPDQMCADYGADTFRLYEMSMGPLDLSRPWETRAIVGAQRFLQRVWRNVVNEETGQLQAISEHMDQETARLLARTCDQVRGEYENLRINTAISKLIVLNNHLTSLTEVPREAIEKLVLMLAPVAPHIAEELWQRLGHPDSLAIAAFPIADPALLVEDTVTCVVQVSGKVRERLEVPADISEADVVAIALASEKVQRFTGGVEPRKVIVRLPNLVNIVPGC